MRLRLALRRGRLLLLDALDGLLRRRPPLTPPRRAIHDIGGSDFQQVGRHLAGIALEQGGLTPSGTILDAGCGYGRLAVPLLSFLGSGEYVGFDVSRAAIAWCRDEIERRHPRFRFIHADVRNRHYNRRGRLQAEHYRFPMEDAVADLVFASSLFTHLTPAACRRYIEESARVLREGGRLVASFFLLNDFSRARIAAGRGEPRFAEVGSESAVQDPGDPEAAAAFAEEMIREAIAAAGMQVVDIHYGSWCEREGTLSYQDFVVAEKQNAPVSTGASRVGT